MLRITPFLIALVPVQSIPPASGIAIDRIQSLNGPCCGFGRSMASLGDLDGDGVPDLAVGSPLNTAGAGRVWIDFMRADGTVRASQVIDSAHGGPVLDVGDVFGSAVAPLGDLDGDGVLDLAVGAPGDDDGGLTRGAVWILFLQTDGTVRSEQKISQLAGGVIGTLVDGAAFGIALASLGDLDGDGNTELAVGADGDPGGGAERGAVWILFLGDDGTVSRHRKIAAGPHVDEVSKFGGALTGLGDLDGDGTPDLAVGARLQDAGGWNRGAVYVVLLNPNGSQRARVRISSGQAGFGKGLRDGDRFGSALQALGDLDMDGTLELAVGADGNDDGRLLPRHLLPYPVRRPLPEDRGGVWLLSLRPDANVAAKTKWSSNVLPLDDGQEFGSALGSAGDLDGNGWPELVVGSDPPELPVILFLAQRP